MARTFDDAASEYLEAATAVVTAQPLTLACWFRTDDLTNDQTLISIADVGVADHFWELLVRTTGAVRARNSAGATQIQAATSTTTVGTNTWGHACGVFTSTTSRAAYLNGAGKGTNTSLAAAPTNLDVTAVGRRSIDVPIQYMSGRIAEVAIWNVALSDGEIAALGLGVSPLRIRPESLVCYVPIWGHASPEISVVGSTTWVVTGTAQADHSPAERPFSRPLWLPYAVAAGGLSIPVAMHLRRMQGVS